jgi:hypothetical protein
MCVEWARGALQGGCAAAKGSSCRAPHGHDPTRRHMVTNQPGRITLFFNFPRLVAAASRLFGELRQLQFRGKSRFRRSPAAALRKSAKQYHQKGIKKDDEEEKWESCFDNFDLRLQVEKVVTPD